MKIYQVVLLLLLPLTSNSQACDVCEGIGEFNPDKQVNATFTCADLLADAPGDGEDAVDEVACVFLKLGFLLTGCCSDDSNVDCSLCEDGTLTNPELVIDIDDPETAETESATCGEFDTQLAALGDLGLGGFCGPSAAQARLLGCQCKEGSPAAHANVKIASLVVVGATFISSFFF
jgi:hypothetical protein